jgi:hypothetical protein
MVQLLVVRSPIRDDGHQIFGMTSTLLWMIYITSNNSFIIYKAFGTDG